MEIGLLTNFLVKEGMKSIDEVAEWASANGFQDLEVGPTLSMNKEDFSRVLESGKIHINAMTYCRNFLSTDLEEAKQHIDELMKRIQFAGELGIGTVVTSTGIDKSVEEGVYDRADAIRKIPERSLEQFFQTFDSIIDLAEKSKVKIAFENCPLMGNIAISPVMWRKIFEKLDSKYVGLAYDPSHLIWQFIDPYAPIQEFKERIFHVHAKDTQIHRSLLEETGFLTDFKWFNYRIPGRGELDWERFIGELKKIGYDKTISIEHEDADYESNLEAVQEGLLLGKKYISQYI